MRGGRDQGFLYGVLGGVEVTEPPDKDAEDLGSQLAQQVLDGRRYPHSSGVSSAKSEASITRRTPIGCCCGTPPGPGTHETLAAISIARSAPPR